MASQLEMSRVNATISISPGLEDAKTATKEPSRIIILSWMGALPKHVLKYVAEYRRLYPHATIMTVASEQADFMWRSVSAQKSNLKPLIPLLAKDEDADGTLVHLFSNGGALNLLRVCESYRESTGRMLPVQSIILDSAPGHFDLDRGFNAMTQGLPKAPILRLICVAILYPIAVIYFVFARLFPPNINTTIRSGLNNPELLAKIVPRLYIWTTKDQIVDPEAVSDHAEDAKELGYQVKTLRFENGAHVSHLRDNSASYWAAVQQLWNDSLDS